MNTQLTPSPAPRTPAARPSRPAPEREPGAGWRDIGDDVRVLAGMPPRDTPRANDTVPQ